MVVGLRHGAELNQPALISPSPDVVVVVGGGNLVLVWSEQPLQLHHSNKTRETDQIGPYKDVCSSLELKNPMVSIRFNSMNVLGISSALGPSIS